MQDLGTRVSAPEHRSPEYLARRLSRNLIAIRLRLPRERLIGLTFGTRPRAVSGTPATGEDVADFLLELAESGASLSEIQFAAAAILDAFDGGGAFIDRRLVRGGVAMIEAMLSPNRTLN
jgi:hypothetical protein